MGLLALFTGSLLFAGIPEAGPVLGAVLLGAWLPVVAGAPPAHIARAQSRA